MAKSSVYIKDGLSKLFAFGILFAPFSLIFAIGTYYEIETNGLNTMRDFLGIVGIFASFMIMPMIILLVMLPFSAVLPRVYRDQNRYYYRKIWNIKEITKDRIERIERISPFLMCDGGYYLYMKGEKYPIPILLHSMEYGKDSPYFAEEIVEKFLPENSLPVEYEQIVGLETKRIQEEPLRSSDVRWADKIRPEKKDLILKSLVISILLLPPFIPGYLSAHNDIVSYGFSLFASITAILTYTSLYSYLLIPFIAIIIILTSRFPVYYKYRGDYYYRKVWFVKKLDEGKIDYVEKTPPFLMFGKRYNIHLKTERNPLPILLQNRLNLGDIPGFAEEILEEFPPEDFPPPGE